MIKPPFDTTAHPCTDCTRKEKVDGDFCWDCHVFRPKIVNEYSLVEDDLLHLALKALPHVEVESIENASWYCLVRRVKPAGVTTCNKESDHIYRISIVKSKGYGMEKRCIICGKDPWATPKDPGGADE